MNHARSIELLNKAVGDELQAVHQYLYFHFHLDDQGFRPLADLFKRIAIQEMGHVERLAERILFLKGELEMTVAGPLDRTTDAAEMVTQAAAMEEASARDYNLAAVECAANADSASRHVFEQLVQDEESHFDLFEKQLDNIRRFGPNYLALQSFAEPTKAELGA